MRWKQSFFWPRVARGSIPISSFCSRFSIIYKFCAVSLLSITYIFRQSSDSCQAAIRQSLGSRQAFVRPLSGHRQAVIRQSSGSRQAVVRQSSGSHQAISRQYSGSRQAVIRQSSGSHDVVVRQLILSGHIFYILYTKKVKKSLDGQISLAGMKNWWDGKESYFIRNYCSLMIQLILEMGPKMTIWMKG